MFYRNGELYFADPGAPGVFRYKDNETRLLSGGFSQPLGVYVDADGTVYVADEGNGVIRRSPYKIIYKYAAPHGIYFFNSTFYTTDYRNGKLLMIAEDGIFTSYFGSNGTLNGNFQRPEDLQIFNNMVYVADAGNGRIEAYSLNFTYLKTYGSGSGNLTLVYPMGIFVDENYVYVADSQGNKVVFYTRDGYPVFAYSINDPRDVVMAEGRFYISQGQNSIISIFNISIREPPYYVKPVFESLEAGFSNYAGYAGLAQALNVSYNATIGSEWSNAKFAFDIGNYGEAFYKAMALNQSNITSLNADLKAALSSQLNSLSQNSSAKDAIEELVQQGNYSGAYSLFLSSPQISRSAVNASNAASPNITLLDVSVLESRLAEAKRLISNYRMNAGVSAIEGAVRDAAGNSSAYDSALLMLDALDEKINLWAYKINTAQEKISKLQKGIQGKELFADYSRAAQYLQNATLLLYSEPEKAAQLAEAGILEAQKARDSASLLFIAVTALALLALALLALFLKDHLIPPKQKYHFSRKE